MLSYGALIVYNTCHSTRMIQISRRLFFKYPLPTQSINNFAATKQVCELKSVDATVKCMQNNKHCLLNVTENKLN